MRQMIKKIIRKVYLLINNESPEKTYLDWCIREGLQLGENVELMSMPDFGTEPYLIKIGDGTTISGDVTFVTHDGATRVIRNLPNGDPDTGYLAPIIIGRNCFIGCRSTILAGVHVGDNTIVGAGSVVTKNIPSNVVAAGVPCKVICTLDEYREKNKSKFMYLRSMSRSQEKAYLLDKYKHDLS